MVLSWLDVCTTGGDGRMTSIGRLMQRCSERAGRVKKSILDRKEEIEDVISTQR